MRIVAWNIRAGGGRRHMEIAGQIRKWRPDVVALSEFRDTEPSRQLARALSESGWRHQRSTTDPGRPAVNALLVASRRPLRTVRLGHAPGDPRRWLHVNVAGSQTVAVMAVHVPNRVTGRKYPFLRSVEDVVLRWRGPPGIVIGDTNTGRIGLDEESSAFNLTEDRWMARMEELGWRDAFRALHPRRGEFTWYSPQANNGFRLDQAFVHPVLMPRMRSISHEWGGVRDDRVSALSDHAALLVDLAGC